MTDRQQCWTCIYGENRTGSVSCMNRTVNKLKHKPDPYCCEFYDEISDSYMDDMEKVGRNT